MNLKGVDVAKLTQALRALGYCGANKFFTKAAVTSSSGVVTVDLASSHKRFELILTEHTTINFSNFPVVGFLEKEILIVQHGTSAKTVTIPLAVGRTTGGTAYQASNVLNSREVLRVKAFNDESIELSPTGRQV